jgi:hypothetical protein
MQNDTQEAVNITVASGSNSFSFHVPEKSIVSYIWKQ